MQLLQVKDLGRMSYARALDLQRAAHAEVLAARANAAAFGGTRSAGDYCES